MLTALKKVSPFAWVLLALAGIAIYFAWSNYQKTQAQSRDSVTKNFSGGRTSITLGEMVDNGTFNK